MPYVVDHPYHGSFRYGRLPASQDENLCLAASMRPPSIWDRGDQAAWPWDWTMPPLWGSKDWFSQLFLLHAARFLWSFVREALGLTERPWTWLGSSKPMQTKPEGGDASSG